jgi:hypothetical protein
MCRTVVLTIVSCLALSGSALAGANDYHKVAIHILPHEDRSCSENFPIISQCPDIIHTYLGCDDIDVFPVFFDLAEVSAIEYGLVWPIAWGDCIYTTCAGDVITGTIVSPGDGVLHEWHTCHPGPVIIPGYAWIGSTDPPAGLAPVPHPGTGFIGTTDCDGVKDVPIGIYSGGVCGVPGDDPCCACGTKKLTWGEIRLMFR